MKEIGLKSIICRLVIPAIIVVTTTARAEDDKRFDVYKLSIADKLLQHWVEDLDGDGLQDIFVVHTKGLEPDQTRWVSIFWHDAERGFGGAPDQSWELDSLAAVLDIGDVSGDASKEICFLTGDGVRYYPLNDHTYDETSVEILKSAGLAVFPSPSTIPMINFVRDWDGDGRDEIGVATFDGLWIYRRDDTGSFGGEDRVLVEVETTIGRSRSRVHGDKTGGLYAYYKFPTIQLLDYNGNGRRDLIATTDDRVIVYLQQEDGTYAAEADMNRLFDVRTRQEKIESTSEVSTQIVDLNQDGYADAVVTKQTAKGLSNVRGVLNIFFGSASGFPEVPNQVIISEGTASAQVGFIDVNGDGRLDIVLPSIQFSLAAIIRILVTRSIKVYFNIFLLDENDHISDRPDFTKEVKFKIDFSGQSDEQAMDLEGDYNGDKRADFVFATSKEELAIYLGEAGKGGRLFSKKPVAKVRADAYGELSSPDLNNDGYSDMIIFYPNNKDRKGMIQVLINKKVW